MRTRILFFFAVLPVLASAQTHLTADDYARAEKFLPQYLNPLVLNGSIQATWKTDHTFWYRAQRADGDEYILVDATGKTRSPYSPSVEDTAGRSRPSTFRRPGPTVPSPDGTLEAFIRDWNLWIRDKATGRETRLTTDGSENFGYATDNAGWKTSDRPIILWSPDSKKIATHQQDEREVGDMHLVESVVGHPKLKSWKYPLPGDSIVAMIHRVVIEIDGPRVVRFQMPPDFHRGTVEDDITTADYKWSPDGKRFAFISTSRFHKDAWVRVADATSGQVKTILHEQEKTHYEMNCEWEVLWDSNEFVWYSQRDNWGQLYLYDLNTGKLKNQITKGPGMTVQIVKIDEKARTMVFGAYGREKGRDPYFLHYYRVGLDGKNPVLLTPEDGHHSIQLSPDGSYFLDTFSRPDVPPVTNLCDRNGKVLMTLEKADISKLTAMGWKPPIPITMKGRDGKTDIYGLMFRPTNFDPNMKYPIVNNAYPGPQSGSVGSRAFQAARGDRQALAELGFIVVTIDGMGTPNRSKSFHDTYYGAMGRDNTLPDQVGGMKQLAQKYPWIDLDRAGMWGHSGGGFITTSAMFRYPDFFKVGVSQSGNHDQRLYEDDWGERYQGALVRNPKGTDNYDIEANQNFAKDLKGKLLLAHGMMDNNVPPYATYLVVEALINANKDFDLLLFPLRTHGYANQNNYMMRRRWDYFVKHLMGAEPPKEYRIGGED